MVYSLWKSTAEQKYRRVGGDYHDWDVVVKEYMKLILGCSTGDKVKLIYTKVGQ